MTFLLLLCLPFLALGCDEAAGRPATPGVTTSTAAAAIPTIQDPASATTVNTPEPTTPPPATATPVPTATPSPAITPTIPPVNTPWSESQLLGHSVQGRPIEYLRLGSGSRWFVVLGAIHGGTECNTYSLVEAMRDRLLEQPALLPDDVTLFLAPLINPDGCVANRRANANGVDLNRNWNTDDWVADAETPQGVVLGSGGPSPLSEPEVAALQSWLLALRDQAPTGTLQVISYHSAVPDTGLAQPAYTEAGQPEARSDQLARAYAEATGYLYSPVWVGNYNITGELIHWAGDNDVIAIDVELPDREMADSVPAGRTESHLETNLRGLLEVLERPAAAGES